MDGLVAAIEDCFRRLDVVFNNAGISLPATAIMGLTRILSLDEREHGIACGQIDIGIAASDMTDAMTKGVPQADGR